MDTMCVGRPPWQPTEWVVKGVGGKEKRKRKKKKKQAKLKFFTPVPKPLLHWPAGCLLLGAR